MDPINELLSPDETPSVEAPSSGLAVGQRVRILIGGPADLTPTGTIASLSDEPGKLVGVALDEIAPYAHSLDGLVEERIDPLRQITLGRGWYTRPEYLEVL